MKFGVFLFVLLPISVFAQTFVSGVIVDEDQNAISSVLVINIRTNETQYSNRSGEFSIPAKENDELRFIKTGFDRGMKTIKNTDDLVQIKLLRTELEIEEVKILPLSGDLARDSKALSKTDQLVALQKSIGLPPPPEKPREKPAEVAQDILLPIIFGQLNVQAVYDVVSGKARRQKALYKYEDLHEKIEWIRSKIESDYFGKIGIEAHEINSFLEFSVAVQPDIIKYVKAKNISAISLLIESTSKIYVERKNMF